MIDRYTKVCLTVIAISLAVIGLRGQPLVDTASAANVLGVEMQPFKGKSDTQQCAQVKRLSSNWINWYLGGGHSSTEDRMNDLSKAAGFANIYNAFCKG